MTEVAPAAATGMPAAARRWQFAVTAIFAVAGFAAASCFSRIPAMRDNLHASTSQMSGLLVALAVGSIVGLILAPHIVARLGPRRALLSSLSILTVGLCLTGLATDRYPSMIAAAAALGIYGFGNGSIDVIMNVEGSFAERAVGQTKLPLMHGFFSIGTILGAAAGAVAATLRLGVTVHLAMMTVLVVFAGVTAVSHIPADGSLRAHPRTATGRFADSPRRWFDARLLVVGLLIAGTTFAEGAGNDWVSLAAVDGHDFANSGGAYVYGCFVLAITVGRFMGGGLLDRFGNARVLAATVSIGIVGVATLILTTHPGLVIVGAVLWGF